MASKMEPGQLATLNGVLLQPPAAVNSTRADVLVLQFEPFMQARSEAGLSVLPKSRKARALIAMLAFSPGMSMTRNAAAVTLWSYMDRMNGLTRLRDTLYRLQQRLEVAGLSPLYVDNQTISFKQGFVIVEQAQVGTVVLPLDTGYGGLLEEFRGIDPALDRWIMRLREQRQRNSATLKRIDSISNSKRKQFDRSPSLLVVDFESISIDPGLVKAVKEEIENVLVRLRWFTTITSIRNQISNVQGTVDPSLIADYALYGNLRQSPTAYRLSVRMVDLNSNGSLAWTIKLEQDKRLGFAIQENFANAVAAQLDIDLLLVEVDRWQSRRLHHDVSAYSLVLEALPAIYRLEKDPFLGAGHLLEQATIAGPELPMAHSWLAYWYIFLVGQDWSINPARSMSLARVAADRAMMLDPKDARAVTIAGHVRAIFDRRLDDASALHELALQLNPALALAWHFSGVTHACGGRLDDALQCISRCRELVPDDPHSFYADGALGTIHLLRGDHKAAAALGRRVTGRNPQFISGYKSYLAALGHLGENSEAADVLQRLRSLEPRLTLQRFRSAAPYQRAQDLEHFTKGLRLAGLT